jgi:predicted transposase/invertase (TIGR01784 family)
MEMNEKEHIKISGNWVIITIELTKFNKKLEELEAEWEIPVYCFRNMTSLKERPVEIKSLIFGQLFETADINNLTTEEMESYKKSIAEYADVRLMMACSLEEGMQKGIKEDMQKGILKGKKEWERESINKIAGNLLKISFSIADIAKATGLTPEPIKQL